MKDPRSPPLRNLLEEDAADDGDLKTFSEQEDENEVLATVYQVNDVNEMLHYELTNDDFEDKFCKEIKNLEPIKIEDCSFYEVLAHMAYTETVDDNLIPVPVYAFTWNPDPWRYPYNKPRHQYRMLLRHILYIADKCFARFLLTPELTVEGNVHIHGWFTMKDPIKFYKFFLPRCKALGFTKVKYGKVNEYWPLNYVLKKVNIMNDTLGNDLPIPLTHNNIKRYRDSDKKKEKRKWKCKRTFRPKNTPFKYKYKF